MLISILVIVTFLTRIINLLNIPIFTDEAIYIRWAQIGLADPAHRFIALTDGKQPLLTWIMYPFLKIFTDPLFAGRFVSVLSAVFAVCGIYLIARELFSRKVALFASILYIFSPFTLIYDRLALMDSLLAMFAIWSLYLHILLVRRLRLDIALILGIIIGLAMLTKSSALFFIYLFPASLILFDLKQKEIIQRFFKWSAYVVISSVIALVMYNSLRLSPWFYIIEQKNLTFIRTFSDFVSDPFVSLIPNLHGLFIWLFEYITLPVFVVVIAGLLWGIKGRDRKIIYLFVWFIVPFLALAAFGFVIFPRFVLFMTLPLLLIAALAIDQITQWRGLIYAKSNVAKYIFALLIFCFPFYQSLVLIISPVHAAIPRTDRNQLFDDWPSGYGVNEVISYINEKSKEGKVVLGTEGTFGLNPAVYEIYLGSNKNVEIHGYWPVGEVPPELIEKAKTYPTYLVFKEKQIIPPEWPLQEVAKYRRGLGNTYLLFYQVIDRD